MVDSSRLPLRKEEQSYLFTLEKKVPWNAWAELTFESDFALPDFSASGGMPEPSEEKNGPNGQNTLEGWALSPQTSVPRGVLAILTSLVFNGTLVLERLKGNQTDLTSLLEAPTPIWMPSSLSS